MLFLNFDMQIDSIFMEVFVLCLMLIYSTLQGLLFS